MTKLDICNIVQIDNNHCLSATCAMALSHFGIFQTQKVIGERTQKIDSEDNVHAVSVDMCGYIADQGLGVIYYGNHSIDHSWRFLTDCIKKQLLVIVGQPYDETPNISGHARLITGISDDGETIFYNDPCDLMHNEMSKKQFLNLWNLKNDKVPIKNELFVVMQNKPELIINCPECNTKVDSFTNDFEHIPEGLSPKSDLFSIHSTGLLHHCKICKSFTHIFFSK